MKHKMALAGCVVFLLFLGVLTGPWTGSGVVAATPEVPVGEISGHWAEAVLYEAVCRGWLLGYPDRTLRLENPVSVAELATLLCRSLELEAEAEVASRMLSPFRDVPESHWALGALRVCRDIGVGDWADGSGVEPDKKLARREVAVMVERAAGFLGIPMDVSKGRAFGDEGLLEESALRSVKALSSVGIVLGTDEGRFEPDRLVTRAEAVAMLVRMADASGSRWDLEGLVSQVDMEGRFLWLMVSGGDVRVPWGRDCIFYAASGPKEPGIVLHPGVRVGVVLRGRDRRLAAFVRVMGE